MDSLVAAGSWEFIPIFPVLSRRIEIFVGPRSSNIAGIARSVDFSRAEMDLKSAHAKRRPGRGSDLRRVIGECAQVVAEERSRACELHARELHSVAGISGEADCNFFEILEGFSHTGNES